MEISSFTTNYTVHYGKGFSSNHFVGASRTDTGVHAWGQVAHFIIPFDYDSLETIHAALNDLFPSGSRVREINAAMPEFHARFSAKSKVFHYTIHNDSIMDPLQRHYASHSVYKLNTIAMSEVTKKKGCKEWSFNAFFWRCTLTLFWF